MIRVGLIDGALPPGWPGLHRQSLFCKADGIPLAQRHAEAMARTIRFHAGDVAFQNAVIFPGRLATSMDGVCAAMEWLAEEPPEIVLCAFGMARCPVALAVATSRLQQAGCLIVGSAPARGGTAYPAACDHVFSVQGDARCAPQEVSRLDLPHATFGACPEAVGEADIRGASPAAAHLAGLLAKSVQAAGRSVQQGVDDFVRFRGREQRGRAAGAILA